jgi:DNA-binding NarL/FixJ family response regulator
MRVVIAEDSVLLRQGLVHLLTDAGLVVVAAVGTADALLHDIDDHHPDVCVIDVRMPPGFIDEGIRAAQVVRAQHPEVGVLILSQYVEERYASDLISDSVAGFGYLLKDRVADVEEFVEAVRRVGAGGTALDPEVVAQLIARGRRQDSLAGLTARERTVLQLMAEGRSNAGIAVALHVTEGSVEKYISAIFTKLGLPRAHLDHRRVLAVLRWVQGTF